MSEPTEKPRGGARRNAGRNTELPAGETVTQSTVMLDDMTRRKAKVLGRGNLSMGLRFAVGHAFDRYQADKLTLPGEDKPKA